MAIVLLTIYSIALWLLWPLVVMVFVWRFGLRRTLRGLPERLAVTPAPRPLPAGRPRLWIHAASVGEVRAAEGLLRRLPGTFPGSVRALTCTNVTGEDLARRQSLAETVRLAPVDAPWCVNRLLDVWQPDALVLIETELWPHWLRQAQKRKVPVVVLNARISDRTLGAYRALKSLWAPLLESLSWVGAQSEEQAARWVSLGAKPARVVVTGNLKLDVPLHEESGRPALFQKYGFQPGERILVAGSTHAGEEHGVVDAFLTARSQGHLDKLVLAPRHMERAPEVVRLVESKGLAARRRSENGAARAPDVLVLDSVGELAEVYGVASAAFVGGSFVPRGGQNPLEPARWGVPVLFGPHMENFRETSQMLLSVHGAFSLQDGPQLSAQIARWAQDPAQRQAAGAAAAQVAAAQRGAIEKSLTLLRKAVGKA